MKPVTVRLAGLQKRWTRFGRQISTAHIDAGQRPGYFSAAATLPGMNSVIL
jgi:hypothetical protein